MTYTERPSELGELTDEFAIALEAPQECSNPGNQITAESAEALHERLRNEDKRQFRWLMLWFVLILATVLGVITLIVLGMLSLIGG